MSCCIYIGIISTTALCNSIHTNSINQNIEVHHNPIKMQEIWLSSKKFRIVTLTSKILLFTRWVTLINMSCCFIAEVIQSEGDVCQSGKLLLVDYWRNKTPFMPLVCGFWENISKWASTISAQNAWGKFKNVIVLRMTRDNKK